MQTDDAPVSNAQETDTRFRKAFDEGPLGMAIVGTDYHVLEVNARLCEMLGYTAEEFLTSPVLSFTASEDVAGSAELARRLLAGEIPRYTLEKRYMKKDGSVFRASLWCSIIRSGPDSPGYFLGMIEDITERKHAEAEHQQRIREESAGGQTMPAARRPP